ncbi:MAG: T9SS type A sorting domain-containing protein [Calditrichaeota bacterium]|nr:T9SS type A sorting domain-containing protein [Calditrichota bacterium]
MSKRNFLPVLMVILVAFGAVTAFGQTITLTIPDTMAQSGASISIPIMVSDVTGLNVLAYDMSVTFDQNVLDATGFSRTGTILESWSDPTVNDLDGQYNLVGAGTAAMSGSGVFIYINFDVVGNPGDTTTIHFNKMVFNEGDPAATTTDGKFTIEAAASMVTFQVNMSIKQREMTFDPGAGDIVAVRGSFNGWSGNDQECTDADGDTVYTGTFDVGTDPTIYYKYVLHKADGSDVWESDPNREFANTGSQTLPVTYFDRDSVYTPPADVFVTFQVNMSIKLREEVFKPNDGDLVVVRGSFNGWSGNNEECTDADGDSIYTGAFNIGTDPTIFYKYVIHKADGTDMWEDHVIDNSGGNRYFDNPMADATLPVVFWDDDDEFSGVTKTGAILFNVDMQVWEDAGFFDRNLDSLEIRGGFNGWASGDYLERVPGMMIYEKLMSVEGIVGSEMNYKYYLNYNDKTLWSNGDWGYEVPYTRGGGNRSIVFEGTDDQMAPLQYMNDIPHGGVIPEGKTVTVTFTIDMNPAMSLPTPFNPATDTVTLIPQDPHWAIGQGITPYDETLVTFTDDNSDGIYTGTLEIHGPTIYGMEYAFRYGADDITEGGGFDFGRYRTRYINPNSDGTYPDTWTFPVDTFQLDPPLPVEEAPLRVAVDELIQGRVTPDNFTLQQNYPNPFNPTTMITYSIPKLSHVSVKIYNMLGQEIATLVNMYKAPGTYKVSWDGKDYTGKVVAGGVYFYHIEAGDFNQTMKMLFLK